jgi:hypothetical protein
VARTPRPSIEGERLGASAVAVKGAISSAS